MIYALYGYGAYDDDEYHLNNLHVFKSQSDRELWTSFHSNKLGREFFTSYYLLEANCSINNLTALSFVAMQTPVESEILIWTKTDDEWDCVKTPILIETKPTKVNFTNLDKHEIKNLDKFRVCHEGAECKTVDDFIEIFRKRIKGAE